MSSHEPDMKHTPEAPEAEEAVDACGEWDDIPPRDEEDDDFDAVMLEGLREFGRRRKRRKKDI